jgi:NitT/TauT family transport system substrate-binding protein
VAQDAGFFRDAGIELDIKTVSGDQNAIRALISGDGDAAVIGFPVLYSAVLSGAKIKGIGGGNQTLADYFLVLGDGKGETLEDAAGKILAISTPASMPQLYPELLFQAKGITSKGTRYVAVGGMSARLQAVIAEKVDGTVIDTLNVLVGEKTGKIKIVADVNKDLSAKLGYEMTVTRSDMLNDPVKRKAIAALVEGTIQGARRTVEQPDSAVESFSKRLNGSIDRTLLKTLIEDMNKAKVWGLNGGVETKLHDDTVNTYLAHHLIPRQVDYDQAFDPSLVNQAVKELGEQKGWW